MNREDIIRMAREAGLLGKPTYIHGLEAFADLVATAEREACAKVCEENATDLSEGDWDSACINCANHIRARGNQ
jgi:hypothetical protein